jgi:hypothetical protein
MVCRAHSRDFLSRLVDLLTARPLYCVPADLQ